MNSPQAVVHGDLGMLEPKVDQTRLTHRDEAIPVAYDPAAQAGRYSSGRKRVCALWSTNIVLIVILILVIVAAAIGGGVGGTMAVRKAINR
jgi:hypothetical protein